jgi:hypothetical protein
MSEQWAVWRRRASGGQAGEPAATDERRAGGRAGWVCATRRTERSLPDTLKREREYVIWGAPVSTALFTGDFMIAAG